MTSTLSLPATALPATALPATGFSLAPAAADAKQLGTAARQFEAIFVRQMLAASRKASFGDALFGSSAGENFREMLDARFADVASERGALSLAKQIEAQLAGRMATQRSEG